MSDLAARAAPVRLLALDVDGVLTDGGIYYGNNGEELKRFNIKDGLGIKLLQRCGIEVAIITGRSSALVQRRAAELGIEAVIQGREDKRVALNELRELRELAPENLAYMGDDLPDLGAILAAGLGLAPADAVEPVREAADWVAPSAGGSGAVRDAAQFLLEARGQLQDLLESYR